MFDFSACICKTSLVYADISLYLPFKICPVSKNFVSYYNAEYVLIAWIGFSKLLLKLWFAYPILPSQWHTNENTCRLYQVWAVGRLPNVGAAVIWKRGLSSAKPPGGNCEQPVVNCSRRAISSCVKLATAVQNQSRIRRNSEDPPLTTWWARKSAMLYSPVPHSNSCKKKKKKLHHNC